MSYHRPPTVLGANAGGEVTNAVQDDINRWVAALPAPDTVADPYPLYRKLRDHTPVFGYKDYPPGTVPGQDEAVTAWALMTYDDVVTAARDHETFSSRDPLQEQSSAPSLMLVNHDNPEHDRLRRFVNPTFAFRQIEGIKPWLAERIHEMTAAFDGTEREVVDGLTSLIPARVMMRLLGQPDADAPQCRDWANAFMLSADLSPEQRQASNEAMLGYFVAAVTAQGEAIAAGNQPSEGLIGALLAAEVDGEKLTPEEVIRFCITLVVAGAETTTYLLTNLLHNLATMPDVAHQLRSDRDLILPFINETLRHSGPPQRLFRVATRDVVVSGKAIKSGDWVALFFGAANHDPSVFPEPDRFDLSRDNLRQQLSMGVGLHQCLGFAVAKSEAAALVEVVLDRFPGLRPGSVPPVAQTASLLTHSFEALTLEFSSQ